MVITPLVDNPTPPPPPPPTKMYKPRAYKVMLRGRIRNDDFKRNAALQHFCDVASNGCNVVPILLSCVALKIVVANRPV